MVAASAPPYAPQLQVPYRGERSFQHSGGLSTGLGMRGRSAFPVWDCTQRAEYQLWHPLSKEERAEKLQWVREPRTASPLSSRAAHCGAVTGNTLSNASGFRKGRAGLGPVLASRGQAP